MRVNELNSMRERKETELLHQKKKKRMKEQEEKRLNRKKKNEREILYCL